MSTKDKKVNCSEHGIADPAYVCQHLNLKEKVGFIQSYDLDNPDNEILNAWCSECDKILMEEGEWNDRSESFANIRMICSECFYKMRSLNGE
jgi:hypothetical protein